MFSPVPGFSCDAGQYPHFVGGQFKLYQISKRLFATILPERVVFSPVPGFSYDTSQYPHFVGGHYKLYQISKRLFATTQTQLPAL